MQERRRVPRNPVRMAAKVLMGPSHTHDCVVRDISTLGARLEFTTTASLPDRFELAFEQARTLRICRVAWRTNTQVGVEFQGISFGHAA
jgi:PilZ domain